jgi:prephenate dehydrogenase
VKNCQSSQKEKFYSYASYCWNGIFGTIGSDKRLVSRKTNIICEVEKTTFKLQERALALFQEMGMRIRYMDPKSHDKHTGMSRICLTSVLYVRENSN